MNLLRQAAELKALFEETFWKKIKKIEEADLISIVILELYKSVEV